MKTSIAIATLVLVALLTGWVVQRARGPAPVAAAPVAATTPSEPVKPPSATELAALQATPQVREYRERQAFEDRARRFLQQARTLGAVEREQQAQSLTAQIDAYERSGGLSAGEGLLLRSGLIRATVPDEDQQTRQIAALMERYALHAQERTALHLAQQRNDPRFLAYKTRERQIVAEVAALRELPPGLSRDQVLRQRLQAERELLYR